MPSIHILNDDVRGKIAAGEVIIRPASVVKELIENSIDAGANRIEVEIQNGGKDKCLVNDNGIGMGREDAQLALERYATSKILSVDDISSIRTFGFRGEALASIASVSRFTLCSHQQGEEGGWQLSHDGKGGLSEIAPCALPPGTSIEVRDLFFNIPARRKFLRSERTEFLHVEEVVRRLALSRFDVAFTLTHNSRQVLRLRQANDEPQQLRRVGDVLGRGFMQHALKLSFEAAGMRLSGWLARPEFSRSQADGQYFYLNGRMVRDKLINHAVRQAHQDVVEMGRHPAFLLYLEVDPRQVDINVHPTKHEVRFRESRLVHDFIHRALLNAMEETKGISIEAELPPAQSTVPTFSPEPRQSQRQNPAPEWRRPARAQIAEQIGFYRQSTSKGRKRDTSAEGKAPGPLGSAKAILHDRYLLAENSDGPLLLDLNVAREQVLNARMEEMFANGEVQSQPLLIPLTLTLEAARMARLEPALEQLLRLGFVVERLGEDSLVIREVPVLLRGADVEKLMQQILDVLLQTEVSPEGDISRLIGTLSRQVVETAPMASLAEADRLLRELESLPDQGRGLWRQLPVTQLAHWVAGKG